MQTSFDEQIKAVVKAMKSRAKKVKACGRTPEADVQWKALNDAASTIVSVQLTSANQCKGSLR